MTFFTTIAQRVLVPEVMDDPTLNADEHYHALQGLSRINRLSASSRIAFQPVAQLARSLNVRRLRVLDIATGSGDIPLQLWRRGQRDGLELEVLGVDVSPRAVAFGRERAAAAGADIHFEILNVFEDPLPKGFDVVMCSLFLHHLEYTQAVALLQKMAAAARHVMAVNDLLRSRMGLLAAETVCRVATRSPVVHVDGPRSVRAAFTLAEAAQLATEAGLHNAQIVRRWPFRFLLTCPTRE